MTEGKEAYHAPAESGMGTFAAIMVTAMVHWVLFLCIGGGVAVAWANQRREAEMNREKARHMRESFEKLKARYEQAVARAQQQIQREKMMQAKLEAELEQMRRIAGDDPRFRKAGGK